jgi:hypothetical protein
MPNLKKVEPGQLTTNREIENTCRVLETVGRQIEDYKRALNKVLEIRSEINASEELSRKLRASPEALRDYLSEKGIAEHLATGMAAEEFKSTDFKGGGLGIWTYDCCCTACCFTCWSSTCSSTNVSTTKAFGPSYE